MVSGMSTFSTDQRHRTSSARTASTKPAAPPIPAPSTRSSPPRSRRAAHWVQTTIWPAVRNRLDQFADRGGVRQRQVRLPPRHREPHRFAGQPHRNPGPGRHAHGGHRPALVGPLGRLRSTGDLDHQVARLDRHPVMVSQAFGRLACMITGLREERVGMIGTLHGVVIDCADPQSLASFYERTSRHGAGAGRARLGRDRDITRSAGNRVRPRAGLPAAHLAGRAPPPASTLRRPGEGSRPGRSGGSAARRGSALRWWRHLPGIRRSGRPPVLPDHLNPVSGCARFCSGSPRRRSGSASTRCAPTSAVAPSREGASGDERVPPGVTSGSAYAAFNSTSISSTSPTVARTWRSALAPGARVRSVQLPSRRRTGSARSPRSGPRR